MFDFAIAQPLALQERVDAGLENHLVVRPRQVIVGPHRQTMCDTVDIVKRRDHDHRQMPQPLVRLEPLEHFEPVHFGHEDVEQDDVE